MSKIRKYQLRLNEDNELSYKELDSLSDEELVALAKEGREDATEILIKRYQYLGAYIARKYFVKGMDQEDLDQEALIALWQSIEGFDESRGTFYSYVSRIMNNRIIDLVRSDNTKSATARNQAQSLDQTVGYGEDDNETPLGATIPSDYSDTEASLAGADTAEKVAYFILSDNVSDTERETLQQFIKGYKTQEIADMQGKTYKQVQNALCRVRGKLRKEFPELRESRSYRKKSVSVRVKVRGA